jgi:hypothetical protein
MFKIARLPRLKRPVPLFVEVDGVKEDHSFSAVFQIIEIDRANMEDEESQKRFLNEVVVGLDDIADEDGEIVPFSRTLLDGVIARYDSRAALIKAYFSAALETAQGN